MCVYCAHEWTSANENEMSGGNEKPLALLKKNILEKKNCTFLLGTLPLTLLVLVAPWILVECSECVPSLAIVGVVFDKANKQMVNTRKIRDLNIFIFSSKICYDLKFKEFIKKTVL